MKKAKKIVAGVLILVIVSSIIITCFSDRIGTPPAFDYKAIPFENRFSIEKTDFAIGEEIKITLLMHLSFGYFNQYIGMDDDELYIVIDESPYYEVVSKNRLAVISDIKHEKYKQPEAKYYYASAITFTIKVTEECQRADGAIPIRFKARYEYYDYLNQTNMSDEIQHFCPVYEPDDYYFCYLFSPLMTVDDDGVHFNIDYHAYMDKRGFVSLLQGYKFVTTEESE